MFNNLALFQIFFSNLMFKFLFSAIRDTKNTNYLKFQNQNVKKRQTWVGLGWFCMPENGIFRSGDG